MLMVLGLFSQNPTNVVTITSALRRNFVSSMRSLMVLGARSVVVPLADMPGTLVGLGDCASLQRRRMTAAEEPEEQAADEQRGQTDVQDLHCAEDARMC